MRKQLVSAMALSLIATTSLSAKDIALPEDKPQLSFRIPDDWTVSSGETGFQAVSPETNAFVYAKIMKRPKDDPNAWLKSVVAKLQERGVSFEAGGEAAKASMSSAPSPHPVTDAKPAVTPSAVEPPIVAMQPLPAPPVPAPMPIPSDASKPGREPAPAEHMVLAPLPTENATPAAAVASSTAGEAKSASARPQAENKPVEPSAQVPSVASPVVPPSPTLALNGPGAKKPVRHLPRHALPYKNTSLHGVPVDVELMTFTLPDRSVFFLFQESGRSDDRVVDIINSVTAAP